MTDLSLQTGRVVQKQKTRRRILEATKLLMQSGKSFGLEDVAKESNISRATMYRYFSSIDVLCSETRLDIHTKKPEILFAETEGLNVIEKILYIQNYFNDLALNNETAFRKYLSVYLKEDISKQKHATRGSRRTATLKLVLNPYKKTLGKKSYEQLINVSTALMGIEPIISTKDVSNLDNQKSKASLAWGLKIILNEILNNQTKK